LGKIVISVFAIPSSPAYSHNKYAPKSIMLLNYTKETRQVNLKDFGITNKLDYPSKARTKPNPRKKETNRAAKVKEIVMSISYVYVTSNNNEQAPSYVPTHQAKWSP
jgi:hypothetical protein